MWSGSKISSSPAWAVLQLRCIFSFFLFFLRRLLWQRASCCLANSEEKACALRQGGQSEWHQWHALIHREEPRARVPQAAARPLAPGDVWKASSSWAFLFSRSAFNWFLTAVRFLLVTGMKLLLFFSLGDLLISIPLSLWLWQLCGFCNWFILSQCFL